MSCIPSYADNREPATVPTSSHPYFTALWGTPATEPRLYLGLWSVHATDKKRNNHNQLLGVSYGMFTIGTLVNSYYKRAYTVGLQRFWLKGSVKHDINYELGYRLGLITGYKGHNMTGIQTLKNSPIIPYVQVVFGLNYKYLGWEISAPDPYVLSTGFYIRFD
jgi:hypothetical protein